MMRLIYRAAEFLRRQHITYQRRHAAHRTRMMYNQYVAATSDLTAALFAEKRAEDKLQSIGVRNLPPASKNPLSDHDLRRIALLVALASGIAFIALIIWPWW